MTPVFLDTVGLLATWDIRDLWHSAASSAYSKILANRWYPMTSLLVLFKCGNASARRPYRTAPTRLRRHLIATAGLIVPSENDVSAARDEFEKGQIGGAGIVDHVSFALMRNRGIQYAFSNDQHFKTAGFTILF